MHADLQLQCGAQQHLVAGRFRQRTWGSIMRGQRLALLMMIAFSTLTVSDGSPAIVQARTCTGSASVFVRLASGLCGKDTSSSFAHQSANRALR
jgi:hypothetical protein